VRRLRRILRLLFNAATVISLLLWAVVTVFWIRSTVVAEHWSLDRGASGITYQIGLHYGGLNLSKSRWNSVARRRSTGWTHVAMRRDEYPEDYRAYFRAWTWFEFKGGDGGWDHYFVYLRIPFWFMFLATILLPAAALRRHINRRRHTIAGVCRKCGYDLRATPDRCPECGTSTVSGVSGNASVRR
jgi:hypothetical protein